MRRSHTLVLALTAGLALTLGAELTVAHAVRARRRLLAAVRTPRLFAAVAS